MNPNRYSQCVELLEFRDGLWLLSGHEPINDKTDYEGKEEEVQVAEKRLLFLRHGLGVCDGLSVHVCHVNTTDGGQQESADISPVEKLRKHKVVLKLTNG